MKNHDNYQKILQNAGNLMKKNPEKPRLLLNTCCGPCAVYPLFYLHKYFKIIIDFYNPNIYSLEEIEKRKKALIKVAAISMDLHRVDFELYPREVEAGNLKRVAALLQPYSHEKEGGMRCRKCIELRLRQTFAIAQRDGIPFVMTTLTSSSRKDEVMINSLGKKLEQEYPGVVYFCFDFKQAGGQEYGLEFCKRHRIYRQNFCGCLYSLIERKGI